MSVSSTVPSSASDDHSSTSVPLSDDVLVSAFDALGDAVACVHRRSRKVRWVTQTLSDLVPECLAGAEWPNLSDAVPELAIDDEVWQGVMSVQAPRALKTMQAKLHVMAFNEDSLLVRLQMDLAQAEQVHAYMQAREYLFSTSRTISVSEMATTLAHEINTPIGTITNMLSGVKARLQRPEFDKDVLIKALDGALDQAQFTSSIIARIRDFTQARRPQHAQLDLTVLAREAVDLLDWYFATHRCSVHLDLPDHELWIRGDSTMLQQVFINLLRNAVDAMRDNIDTRRRVEITTSRKGARIRLLIKDCGHGLDAESDVLFVPFATDKPDGMGVGLNICRSFLELHQGRLWLTPVDTGGCTATVELPLLQMDDTDKSDVSPGSV